MESSYNIYVHCDDDELLYGFFGAFLVDFPKGKWKNFEYKLKLENQEIEIKLNKFDVRDEDAKKDGEYYIFLCNITETNSFYSISKFFDKNFSINSNVNPNILFIVSNENKMERKAIDVNEIQRLLKARSNTLLFSVDLNNKGTIITAFESFIKHNFSNNDEYEKNFIEIISKKLNVTLEQANTAIENSISSVDFQKPLNNFDYAIRLAQAVWCALECGFTSIKTCVAVIKLSEANLDFIKDVANQLGLVKVTDTDMLYETFYNSIQEYMCKYISNFNYFMFAFELTKDVMKSVEYTIKAQEMEKYYSQFSPGVASIIWMTSGADPAAAEEKFKTFIKKFG